MKQEGNIIMRGASGALGVQLVFRQRAGKTVICLPPAPRPDKPTPNQMANRNRFSDANRYAKMVIADAALKARYQLRTNDGASAYNTAFADAFKAPKIHAVNILPDDIIQVHATDNFSVQAVFVSIVGEGNIIAGGQATPDVSLADHWIYATTGIPGHARVIIKVMDLPGNVTEYIM